MTAIEKDRFAGLPTLVCLAQSPKTVAALLQIDPSCGGPYGDTFPDAEIP